MEAVLNHLILLAGGSSSSTKESISDGVSVGSIIVSLCMCVCMARVLEKPSGENNFLAFTLNLVHQYQSCIKKILRNRVIIIWEKKPRKWLSGRRGNRQDMF